MSKTELLAELSKLVLSEAGPSAFLSALYDEGTEEEIQAYIDKFKTQRSTETVLAEVDKIEIAPDAPKEVTDLVGIIVKLTKQVEWLQASITAVSAMKPEQRREPDSIQDAYVKGQREMHAKIVAHFASRGV